MFIQQGKKKFSKKNRRRIASCLFFCPKVLADLGQTNYLRVELLDAIVSTYTIRCKYVDFKDF